MRSLKSRTFVFAVAFLFLLSLDFLGGQSGKVDDPIVPSAWTALVLHFFLWIMSLAAWGRVILNAIGLSARNLGLELAAGSFACAAFMLGLGEAALLLPGLRFFLFILEAAGVALFPRFPEKGRDVSWKQILAGTPIILLISLFVLEALYISPYWDPLHHHLTGVRFFWEHGRIQFPEEAIAGYQEGGFELLFLWPHFLFARTGGLGLLPVQIFAQLTHCVLGFGGSLLLVWALASRWIKDIAWRHFALMLAAAPASLWFSVPTAKNDWGIVLWALGGFILLCDGRKYARKETLRLSFTGALWGFTFIAKMSSVFALTGFASIVFFLGFRGREIGLLVAGLLAGAAPLALRNWLGAGNPFFPLLPTLFPGTRLGPTWLEALNAYQASPAPIARVHELIAEFPLGPVALLAPFVAWIKKNPPELRALGAALSIGFTFFALITGKATELRLLGGLLPIAGLIIGVITYLLASRLPFRTFFVPWVLIALLGITLPYRWQAIAHLRQLPSTHLLPRSYVSGEAQGWFRDHYQPGMRAALLVESRVYHSLPFPIVRPWDFPRLDVKLRQSQSAEEFLEILRNEGFTHLILSQEKLDLFFPRDLVNQVEQFVLTHERSFVFQSQFSIVADLEQLK